MCVVLRLRFINFNFNDVDLRAVVLNNADDTDNADNVNQAAAGRLCLPPHL